MKNDFKINLPGYVLGAIEVLERRGHEAYAVGGCIRDALLGITPGDYDITTSALPEETAEAFAGRPIVETGIKHGTVTVMSEGGPLEITTFRTDGEYGDGRHPDNVLFTRTLGEDLLRRDFTVNAMAYSPRTGLIDICGGKDDLEKKVLRCVGDAEKRFTEDALRILRALRFSAVYGFVPDEATASTARRLRERISLLSAERVYSEVRKLICGDRAEEVLLGFPEIVCTVFPELEPSVGFDQRNPHHVYDVYTHTVKCVSACPKDADVRLAALLHDAGKPETFSEVDGAGHFYGHTEASLRLAEEALTRLKAPNAVRRAVTLLIKYHDPVIPVCEKSVRRMLGKLGEEEFYKLLDLKRADNLAQSSDCFGRVREYDELKEIARKVISEGACFSLRRLCVNGDDLIAAGIPQGRRIGVLLNELLSKVISGELPNERETLLRFLAESGTSVVPESARETSR